MILSGEMMDVLEEREVDLVEGNETAAVTAAAMSVLMQKKQRERLYGRVKER